MAQRFSAASWVLAALTVALGATGCGRQDTRLQKHQEQLESLGSSTSAIAEAWLAGSVSGTYAVTALERILLLVEQERSAFATVPDMLLDPRGARLSEAAERLSRLLAVMMHDVAAADAQSVRRRLAEIPIAPSERK